MSLSGTVFFPKTILPLRIFEERYRAMLADCLSGDRIFAIATPIESHSPSDLPKFHKTATVGLIRMSSRNSDGTSQLVLEGTERVRIDGVASYSPYPILKVSPLLTTNRPQDELEAEIVVDLLDKVDRINELLGEGYDDATIACHAIDDLEMLTHFILQNFCTSPAIQLNALDATDLVKRCKIVSDYLHLQSLLITDEE